MLPSFNLPGARHHHLLKAVLRSLMQVRMPNLLALMFRWRCSRIWNEFPRYWYNSIPTPFLKLITEWDETAVSGNPTICTKRRTWSHPVSPKYTDLTLDNGVRNEICRFSEEKRSRLRRNKKPSNKQSKQSMTFTKTTTIKKKGPLNRQGTGDAKSY